MERFQEMTVPDKATITLKAKVIGTPRPEVTWLRNNQPLKKSPRIKMTYENETIELVIKDADSEKDTGDYKCIASNTVGKASHGAKITVDVDAKFTRKLREIYETVEYDTLVLECETSHTVSVKWFYEEVELTGMDNRVIIEDGRCHKLVIKNITHKDIGKYKCMVKNQVTQTQVQIIDTKPTFIKRLHDVEVTEKECAILEVEISSDSANVVWKKDNNVIESTDSHYLREKQGNVRKLIINNTTIYDEGEYYCSLIDEECYAELTVIELPPEIKTRLEDKTVRKGDKAVFEIELTKGDALVSWRKNDVEIQFSEHIQLSIDGKRQKLKIYNCDMDDQATYCCQVGQQVSSARLTVYEPTLSFIRKLPEITKTLINKTVELEVELSESVEVKWTRNGVNIQESEKYSFYSENSIRKLIIKNCTHEEEYEYTCIAEDISTTTKLVVEEVPSPPRGPLEVSGMSDTSFTLCWQPSLSNGGSEIIEYIVEIRESKQKDFKKLGSTKGNTDISVNYLEKGHQYFFRIVARNAVGLSEPYVPDEPIVAGARLSKFILLNALVF